MINTIIGAIAAIATSIAAVVALKSHQQQQKQNRRTLFDTTFFNMLQTHQQILNDLVLHKQEKVNLYGDSPNPEMGRAWHEEIITEDIKGRDLFYHTFAEAEYAIKLSPAGNPQKIRGMKGMMQANGFEAYHDMITPTYFDHYFRHLYTILKYIDQNGQILTPEEQYQYATFLRATLSRYELVWLYYNGLSDYGSEKLKPLIEKYSMLKNLRTELLSLCWENQEKLAAAGISLGDFRETEFYPSDYLFFIDKESENTGNYKLSAFYCPDKMHEAKAYFERWKVFLKERSENIKQEE